MSKPVLKSGRSTVRAMDETLEALDKLKAWDDKRKVLRWVCDELMIDPAKLTA